MGAFVSASNLTKSYASGKQRITVLQNLNLEVHAGEFIALMGPSGSGKTTLLNLIGGLDKPDSGSIRVAGSEIEKLSASQAAKWRARHIGFIFQLYNLLPMLTAQQNVEMPLMLTGLPRRERRRRAAAVLELVGLADRAGHKPAALSGGQQQRVAIARALVSDPSLLICDEPTGNLDAESSQAILTLLRALNESQKKTIVMVTHDPYAADCAARKVHLVKGELRLASIGVAA